MLPETAVNNFCRPSNTLVSINSPIFYNVFFGGANLNFRRSQSIKIMHYVIIIIIIIIITQRVFLQMMISFYRYTVNEMTCFWLGQKIKYHSNFFFWNLLTFPCPLKKLFFFHSHGKPLETFLLTFVIGFTLDSMINSYLHSSHFFVSELLIHLCRQLWWTYCKEPAHKQGEIRGRSGSASQWHILQISMDDATEVTDTLFLASGLGLSLLLSVTGITACPSDSFGLEFWK